ncbi:tetratricopeptide repeat protein, partial [Aduncisulcus paluster]
MGNDAKAAELMSEVVHDHPEEAEYRVLKDGLAFETSSLAVRSSLAGLYMSQGRQEEAVKVLLDGVALDPEGTESSDYVIY